VSVALVLAAALATQPAVVEQPRSFGYVIGDIATQRVLLEDRGRAFTLDRMPAAGPLGNWVERRAARIQRDSRGRQWLAVDYQIMNSPQAIQLVTLPAWKLAMKNGETDLAVPEWQISVAALTPEQAFARAGLGGLRPDREAPAIDLTPVRRWMMLWISGALALILLWAGWWSWRNWRAASRQPFAKALREMRGIDEQSPQAWVALHRAFDATAGRVVQPETLPSMFERAPRSRRSSTSRAQGSSPQRRRDHRFPCGRCAPSCAESRSGTRHERPSRFRASLVAAAIALGTAAALAIPARHAWVFLSRLVAS
jgi:mxaA protein